MSCPYCQSDEVEDHEMLYSEETIITDEIVCGKCGKRYWDVFIFHRHEDVNGDEIG